jgi:hypothetical protein
MFRVRSFTVSASYYTAHLQAELKEILSICACRLPAFHFCYSQRPKNWLKWEFKIRLNWGLKNPDPKFTLK